MPRSRSQARDDRGDSTARDGRSGRTALSRARILEAALTLIERDGIEAFSTRRLGAALGVEAMALYHHFPAKDALLDALAEHLLQQVPLPASATGDWRGWMRQVAIAYRDLALRHPRTFPLVMLRRYRARGALAFIEANLQVLTAAGFNLRDALRLTRIVGSFVNGVVLAELAGLAVAGKGGRLSRALPTDLKLVREAAAHLNRADMDGTFESGLDLILAAAGPTAIRRTASKAAGKTAKRVRR